MRIIFLLLCCLLPWQAMAEPTGWSHALTLFGKAKYPAYFRQFEYVNPQAPKGGELKLAHPATFDSVNQFILKGVKAPGVEMIYDTLMTGSLDEPQTYYPLIAQRYRRDVEAGWIEYELNPRARWHDGKPITVEDVIWSLETIKKEADPVYRLTFAPLEKAEQTAPRRVRFSFVKPATREAPLLSAILPILPKHYYATVPFNKTTLQPPLASGAYKIGKVDAGRTIVLQRVPDYWAKDLPVNRGRFNFDRIRYDVYRDATVALQALKAGEYDFRQENVARNWATAYDTPAIRDGRLIKTEFPNALPQGMQAFFYNLRKPIFRDRRVREAIALTLDYEWVNRTMFYSAYKRNKSFFQYTPFAAKGLPEKGDELTLLAAFAHRLPKELFEQPFQIPETDGSGRDRSNLLRAQALLDAAGYKIVEGRRVDQQTMQRVISPMQKGLKRLGIDSAIRFVDDAQYQRRVETRDFDIISGWYNYGVHFPGVEQANFWHSSQADIEGSSNVSGLKHPAADAAIEDIMNAHTLEELAPAARALDRVLLWEHIVIPHWHNDSYRVAYWNKFGIPKTHPPYGLGLETWWIK